ncbi:DUF3631 domain-containing protein [Streptomyces cyaneofuscatus]|uniref:DUF3631 domain-containing protein n=1 Tax=Streptomyces cyaneofuscatus TaxID=66883 RepID=UPI0037F1197B
MDTAVEGRPGRARRPRVRLRGGTLPGRARCGSRRVHRWILPSQPPCTSRPRPPGTPFGSRTTPHKAGSKEALRPRDLLAALLTDVESPWPDYGIKGLTAFRLSALLRDFGIRPANYRFEQGRQVKAYARNQFLDACPLLPRPCPACPCSRARVHARTPSPGPTARPSDRVAARGPARRHRRPQARPLTHPLGPSQSVASVPAQVGAETDFLAGTELSVPAA